MDNGVVADLDLGHVVQADTLDHAAEVHAAHPQAALGGDFFDSSGNRETHGNSLIPLWDAPLQCDLNHIKSQSHRLRLVQGL